MSRPIFAALLLYSASSTAADLRCISWNVESGGADPAVISKQLGDLPRVDIYALQEVDDRDANRYGEAIRSAHGDNYRYFASWTGQNDRLLVAFDESKLDLLEWREIFRYNDTELNDWRHRSPLVCLLKDRVNGRRFYFVTVHLARGDEKLRTSQARGLVSWADDITLPVIAAGDFSLDFNFKTQRGNKAFGAMQQGGVWIWARPDKLVDTNWADRNADGQDDYPDSILDFAFYSGLPPGWKVTSEVIVRPGDFPDDDSTSDHRPIMIDVSMGDG